MAYFLRFFGVDDIVTLPSGMTGNLGTSTYSIRIRSGVNGITLPSTSYVGIIGVGGTGTSTCIAVNSAGLLQVFGGGVLRYGSSVALIQNGVQFDYTINHDAAGAWNIYNNLTNSATGQSGTFTTSISVGGVNSFNQFGRATNSATNYLNGQIEIIELTGFVNAQKWDANLSNGTGSVFQTASGLNQGTLVNFPTDGSQWETDGGGSTPVSFTGTVPDQNAVVGTSFNLSLASYFSGTLTPFAYAVQSGVLPDGLTLAPDTGVISGTPTGIDTTTIVVRATDTGSNTADTNAFMIDVNWSAQVPQGTVTLGTPTGITSSSAAIPYSYSASDQTGFEYRLNGGSAQTVTTTPLVVSGLTASTAYTVEIRAVNAAGAGTWSSPANFTTSAAAQPPQGTFTIGSITTGVNTASVPYTYSASDQTSIQYRLNGGSAVNATASPQALSGLTAETSYTIEFRAVNAAGNGAWSNPANFATQAEPSTDGTFASEPLRRLVDGVLMANKALTYFRLYNSTTGALVVSKTGLSTNSSGIVSFTDPAVVTGTTYKADWQTADGEFCMPSKAAT